MSKAKRMSDMFASSADNDANSAIATATPPYSSDGPTLPLIDVENANKVDATQSKITTKISKDQTRETPNTQKQKVASNGKIDRRLVATMHPSLYEPWKLLPVETLRSTEVKARVMAAQMVVPIVFTRNQNVKAGINRLKTYLGANRDMTHPIEKPDVLGQKDAIIAISAQGEGTSKLISILDMVRRIVAPGADQQHDADKADSWWLYISLASVEANRKNHDKGGVGDPSDLTQETEEEEAFEPMELDKNPSGKIEAKPNTRKIPVLTAWMTKKPISAFREAFGEQTFAVQTLTLDD